MKSSSQKTGNWMRAWVTVGVCIASLAAPLAGQERGAFETVTITRSVSNRPPMPVLNITPQRLAAPGASLLDLIELAYGIEPYQIAGFKAWMGSESYVIAATTAAPVDRPRMMVMLQDMLASRFQLKFHREDRELSVFALVVDKGGSKLVPLAPGESPEFSQQRGDRVIRSVGSTVTDLVRLMNSRTTPTPLGKPVVDRTELKGNYRIRLTFSVSPDKDGPGGKLVLDWGYSLGTELGLKLESAKATTNMLVIDNAAKPTLDKP
jgi:uncharacterized protein (TIGR03435 family)